MDNKRFETADIGESLLRVMKYWTVRDKFSGVHQDLKDIGVTNIEVTKEGLVFEGDISDYDGVTDDGDTDEEEQIFQNYA